MIALINIFCCMISAFCLVKAMKHTLCIQTLCLIVFDAAYVLPLAVESILGNAKTPYYGFILAQNDTATSLIYVAYVLIFQFILIMSLSKRKNINTIELSSLIDEWRNKINQKKVLKHLAICMIISSLIGIIISPNPLLYFTKIGAFAMHTVQTTAAEVTYHTNVMSRLELVTFLGVLVLKLYDVKNLPNLRLVRAIGIVLVAIVNGKRTWVTFLMLGLLAIDFFDKKNQKSFLKKIIFSATVILVYFIFYAYATGKYYYNTNWYSVISEYFFRSNSVKVAIYSLLNPEKLKIIEYPCQTVIYDLFFAIPRSIWPDKPFPYVQYYSSAIHGFTKLTFVGWYFQVGCHAEIISNFGMLGIIVSPLFVSFLCKLIENSKTMITFVLGMIFVLLIQIFEYSDSNKVLFCFWMFMFFIENMQLMLQKNIKHLKFRHNT